MFVIKGNNKNWEFSFLRYLQFDILKWFVADGASSLALLLVLLVLVYGSTVLRGYKHKEEKARETRQRGTETVWEVIIPSHIVTGCGSINYTPENDDTWPVLVLGELRDRESRGEPAEESGVTSGRHDCSWIIKSNRHYRFIYPLGRTHHSSFLLRPKSSLSFPFFSIFRLYNIAETKNRWHRNYLDTYLFFEKLWNESFIIFTPRAKLSYTVSLFV